MAAAVGWACIKIKAVAAAVAEAAELPFLQAVVCNGPYEDVGSRANSAGSVDS